MKKVAQNHEASINYKSIVSVPKMRKLMKCDLYCVWALTLFSCRCSDNVFRHIRNWVTCTYNNSCMQRDSEGSINETINMQSVGGILRDRFGFPLQDDEVRNCMYAVTWKHARVCADILWHVWLDTCVYAILCQPSLWIPTHASLASHLFACSSICCGLHCIFCEAKLPVFDHTAPCLFFGAASTFL